MWPVCRSSVIVVNRPDFRALRQRRCTPKPRVARLGERTLGQRCTETTTPTGLYNQRPPIRRPSISINSYRIELSVPHISFVPLQSMLLQ